MTARIEVKWTFVQLYGSLGKVLSQSSRKGYSAKKTATAVEWYIAVPSSYLPH